VTGAQIVDFRVRDDEGARVSGVSAGSGRSNGPVQRHAARPTTRVKVVASVPPVHPAAPDDCHNDRGSSSSVVSEEKIDNWDFVLFFLFKF
jgi:hypothetical protein